jgi:2-phospho-L-lactate/phosphoenolpyruvate guanylyltransferase
VTAIVVPFRGPDAKRRLAPMGADERAELALAMLGDVLAACLAVGETAVVTGDADAVDLAAELGARVVDDPGGGQAAAVSAALGPGRALVVNADLPCATPHDLRQLERAIPEAGLALVEAADGTTNALGLSSGRLFAPLYGPGSAARFRALADSVAVLLPNLARDVDTLDDLAAIQLTAGPRTQAALAAIPAGRA